MVQNSKKLHVYQEAYGLAVKTYKRFSEVKTSLRLKEQLFGSVSSICANLAEMGAFENKAQQKQKVMVCIGEANEAEYWMDLCKDVGLLTADEHKEFVEKISEIRAMLFGLLKTIETNVG